MFTYVYLCLFTFRDRGNNAISIRDMEGHYEGHGGRIYNDSKRI